MGPLTEEGDDWRDLIQIRYGAVAVADIRSMAEVLRSIRGDMQKQWSKGEVLEEVAYHNEVEQTKYFQVQSRSEKMK